MRTLFVVVTGLGCLLGVHVNRTRNQRLAVEYLRGTGDHVWYDYEIDLDFDNLSHTSIVNAAPREPMWMTALFGVDFFHHPVALSFNTKGDKELVHVNALPTLEAIWFGESKITRDGLQHLKGLTRLRELGFWQCRTIDDEALRMIAAHSSLRALNLTKTRVTDAGLVYLDELRNLEYVDLSGTLVTDAGLKRLKLKKLRVDH